MAANPTPDNNDILRALADRLADGCHKHETALGIKQNTEARVRADIATLLEAGTQVGLKKGALDDANVAIEIADSAAVTLLTACKGVLRLKLGERWNSKWEATGFPDQSTAVPNTQDARFALLQALKNYFTHMPASENADFGVTAAACDAAWIVYSDAREQLAGADSAMTTAFENRTLGENALRSRVRGLINELEQLLADDDARWEDFGLNIPANPTAPEAVASVTLEAMTNHRIGVAWPYAVRATRYGIDLKIVGVDDDFARKTSVKDLETILKGLTAGQVVRIRIVAGNDGGEASPSPEAEVMVI